MNTRPYALKLVEYLSICPQVSFGKTLWSFQATWFDKWPWLYWDITSESVFCHICVHAEQADLLRGKSANTAFLTHSGIMLLSNFGYMDNQLVILKQ